MTPNYDYSRIITCKDSALMGATSNDIRALLEQDHSEKMLAAAMAAVSNQTSFLGKTVRFEMKHATQPEVENDE